MRAGAAVTANDVVSGIAGVRWIVDAKLRVVENIKSLSTELDVPLAEDFEMFQQGKIEIGAPGIVERIAPAGPERQSAWSDIGRGVVQEWTEGFCSPFSEGNVRIGATDAISVRPSSEIVGYTGIVRYSDASRASAVDYTEGSTGLKDDNSGKLPAIQQHL